MNVRTLLSADQQLCRDLTLKNKGVDICCVSETSLPEENQTILIEPTGEKMHLYHTGTTLKGRDGVGFAMNRRIANCVLERTPISERIAKVRIGARDFNAQLGGTQAPSLGNFAQGTVCENGKRLLSFMDENRLIATNKKIST